MALLLHDNNIQQFDILTIQEPWYNLYNKSLFNSGSSRFHLAHRLKPDTRTCFYINKRLDLESWEFENERGDLCSIKLTICNREKRPTGNNNPESIWIHNVYNPSLTSYKSTESLSTLPKVYKVLQKPEKHILIEDFNLHHLQWNNPGRFTYYQAANTLLAKTQSRKLELVFPNRVIT